MKHNMWQAMKCSIQSWCEWQYAKAWAKEIRPSWLQFATQNKRPEIKETYRKKILNGYRSYKGTM